LSSAYINAANSRGEDNRLRWLKFDDESFAVYKEYDGDERWVFSELTNEDLLEDNIREKARGSVVLDPLWDKEHFPVFRLAADD
jgi:hypothetical protein